MPIGGSAYRYYLKINEGMGYSTSSGVGMGGRDMFPSMCIKCADEHLKDCLETVSVSFNRGAEAERLIEGDLLPPPLLMEPTHTPDVEPIILIFLACIAALNCYIVSGEVKNATLRQSATIQLLRYRSLMVNCCLKYKYPTIK